MRGVSERHLSEMGRALWRYKSAFVGVAVLSAVLNILLLGGSIYMMLIYDSVLPSHSVPTLVGLLLMMVVIYAFQGLFDGLRGRILADVGASLDLALTKRVQEAISVGALRGRNEGDGLTPMRDLDHIRVFLSGAGPAALIDLPWIIFFLAILFLLHFWLGVTALVGALVLVALTIVTETASRHQSQSLSVIASVRNAMAESHRRQAEIIHALGMQHRVNQRWEQMNRAFLATQQKLTSLGGSLGSLSKVFRMFLQSLVLSVGALLVIEGEATGGVIFASSILAARALAPVDQAIANWRGFIAARQGWERLNRVLANVPDVPAPITALPPPSQTLRVEHVTIVPPGTDRPAIANVTFTLSSGDALAVIGPSASGKSSLVRGLAGVWLPARGAVRLDGATLDQWQPEQLGASLGYLPQSVELLDGTVAQNICRFQPSPPAETIIAAARAAGIHEMIVRLPLGYETPLGSEGGALSAGQRQRLALARALYGNPFLLLLDEPNSNLDSDGEAALDLAIAGIRARGGIVVLVAHRPAALSAVNLVLFLRNGQVEAFGPRDEVLGKILAKRQQVAATVDQQLKQQGA